MAKRKQLARKKSKTEISQTSGFYSEFNVRSETSIVEQSIVGTQSQIFERKLIVGVPITPDRNYISVKELGLSYEPMPIYNWERFLEMEKECFAIRIKTNSQEKLNVGDFKFILSLGAGSFGRVILVMKRDTKFIYAIKMISKKRIMESKTLTNIMNEKQILAGIRFPFTIYLEFFFQDDFRMFFVLPLAIGGDLRQYLNMAGKMDENVARFYFAQLVLAVEYLHHLDLVYRDMKPENVLIDHEGYLKIADFGFCKILKGRTYTMCGTPAYLAPEVLAGRGYGMSVDWWSLGVVLYQMCAGTTPFRGSTKQQIFNRIIAGKYMMPSYFSETLQDLVWNLLQLNVDTRYGNMKRGANDVKYHKWFKTIRWLPLVNRQIESPNIPNISINLDATESYKFEDYIKKKESTEEI